MINLTVATIKSIDGSAWVVDKNDETKALKAGDHLSLGDTLKTGAASSVVIVYDNDMRQVFSSDASFTFNENVLDFINSDAAKEMLTAETVEHLAELAKADPNKISAVFEPNETVENDGDEAALVLNPDLLIGDIYAGYPTIGISFQTAYRIEETQDFAGRDDDDGLFGPPQEPPPGSGNPSADVSIDKMFDNKMPNPEESISFDLVIKNGGPDAAENVVVTDVVPEGLNYLADNGGGILNGTTLTWNLGTINAGDEVVITIDVSVAPGDELLAAGLLEEILNAATVVSTTPDPDLTNNDSDDTVDPQDADLQIVKTFSDDPLPVPGGEPITFDLVVTNLGNDTALNVVAMDVIPDGLTYDPNHPDNINPDTDFIGNTLTWNIGTLEPGDGNAVTLTVTVMVNDDLTDEQLEGITNTAIVMSDTYDPDLDNNEDDDTIDPEEPETPKELTGEFKTNTDNSQGGGDTGIGQMVVTISEGTDPMNASAKIYALTEEGQQEHTLDQGNHDFFDSRKYNITLENVVNGTSSVKVTDFAVLGVGLVTTPPDPPDVPTQIKLDLDELSGGPDRTAHTGVITPLTLEQPITESDDGTAAGQVLTNGNSDDLIYTYGASGNDTLNEMPEDGSGPDVLNGGPGMDIVNGNDGNDIIVFSNDDFTGLLTGSGAGDLDTGELALTNTFNNNDTIDGGDGDDILRIDWGAIKITEAQTDTPDVLVPTQQSVDLTGQSISNIEIILITEEAIPDASIGTTITIEAADILAYTDSDNVISVVGNEGDEVEISLSDGASWDDSAGNNDPSDGLAPTGQFTNDAGQTFNVYATTDVTPVALNVSADVAVTTVV